VRTRTILGFRGSALCLTFDVALIITSLFGLTAILSEQKALSMAILPFYFLKISRGSAMNTRKTVCVIWATGAQGLPVVHALVRDGKYAIRAVTRNASGPDAKMLASWPNVNLAVGNVFDEKFLREIFKGTQLAFVNTVARSTQVSVM
jgi:NmrA-like family